MKTQVKATPIIASDNLQVSEMSMDDKGRDMATYFLRDKIYSNKIQAVVREYLCNAIDEHYKHGVTKPIEAKLSATDDNEVVFSVRDFAQGLSDDGVRKIFGMYFRSTKSGSNDSIGGFGVGSKAGHAYTDTFNIISHFEGVKTSYSCMLGGGDHGVPVGHIYKLDECPTDETGIEINLLVDTNNKERESRYSSRETTDSEKFKNEMIAFLQFAHSPIKLDIYGAEFKTPNHRKSCEVDGFTISVVDMFTKEETNYRGDKVKRNIVSDHGAGVKVKMGDVVYDYIQPDYGMTLLDHTAITITAPIGSFDIPISREGLEDTERNKKTLSRAKAAYMKVLEQDVEPFRNLSFTQLVDKYVEDSLSEFRTAKGSFYTYNMEYIYGDVYEMAKSIWEATPDDLVEETKNLTKDANTGKPIIVSIPNNRAFDTWKSKLDTWCKLKGVKYLGIKESKGYGQEITDCYHIVKAKSTFKFAPVKGNTNTGTVYYQARSIGSYTALTLHNYLRKECNLPVAKTLEEAKKQNEKLANHGKNVDHLNRFILSETKGGQTYRCSPHRHVAAKGLIKDLKEIGIVFDGSGKMWHRKEKIRLDNQNKSMISSYIDKYCEMEILKERTKKIIKKNPEKVLRLVEMFQRIKDEKIDDGSTLPSLRAKVLKEFHQDQYYYRSVRALTRSQLKQILNLK